MALTTQEQVRQAWRDHVWSSAAVKAFSPIVIEHDVTEEYHKEIASVRWQQKVNFFGFRVRRSIEPQLNEQYRLRFFIDVSYTRWADPSGANYNLVLDGIEAVQTAYVEDLGSRWQGVVGGSSPQDGFANIFVTSLGDDVVYRAEYSFEGLVCISN